VSGQQQLGDTLGRLLRKHLRLDERG
jgi:hypothetical protein